MEALSQGKYVVKTDGGYFQVDAASGYPVDNSNIFMATMWDSKADAEDYASHCGISYIGVVRVSLSEDDGL